MLSWVLNNYWPTNTPPEQEGELLLRYAFAPLPAFDPVAAGRFGREVRAAPTVSQVTRLDKFDTGPRPLPRSGASIVDLDLPDGVHATLATPRDRSGLLVRVQDLTGRTATVHLRHPAGTAGRVWSCTADERELAALPIDDGGRVAVDLRPWQVATLILQG